MYGLQCAYLKDKHGDPSFFGSSAKINLHANILDADILNNFKMYD